MPSPGSNPAIVSDLFTGILEALQNRTDITTTQMARWVQRTVRELTETYKFEELHATGPLITLPANQVLSIPISSMLLPGDDYTWLDDPVIFLDPPNNTIGYPMDFETDKAIEPLLHVPGSVPFKYTVVGGNFLFGGIPAQQYQVYLKYYRYHPWLDGNLQGSPLYLPKSWQDIVEYAAAQRGAIAKRWPDMADYLHKILWGDPESQNGDGTRGRPGLMAARILTIERVQSNSTRQVMPQVARY